MTATFLLPFTIGACGSLGGDALRDAFGLVALVAMTPLITIQLMGLIYKFKVSKTEKEELSAMGEAEYASGYTAFEDLEDLEPESEFYDPGVLTPGADTDYVASADWVKTAYEEKLLDAIEDNKYIDLGDDPDGDSGAAGG
jgi:hypothetical protein